MALSKQEIVVRDLNSSLAHLPANMRIFSICLRALYAEKAVSASVSKRFIKIRDDTRKEALVYVNGILPMSTTLVRSIKDFFEYYVALTYDEWVEDLDTIVADVKGYKQCCNAIVQMHESILVPLKKSESEAKVIMSELETLTKEFERKKKELVARAGTKRGWAIGLAFVPGINIIASPILAMCAESDLAKAVAAGGQGDVTNSVIIIVSYTMIPALSSFIDGLRASAGFFSAIEQELESFQKKGEDAQESAKNLHYKMMKKYATDITTSCKGFYAMIPDVRSDLHSIPTEDTDTNYVDAWLKKQQEEISQKYSHTITHRLKKFLSRNTIDESAYEQ